MKQWKDLSCICVFICMYIYIHTHIYIYRHIYIHIYTYIYIKIIETYVFKYSLFYKRSLKVRGMYRIDHALMYIVPYRQHRILTRKM